MERSSSDKYKYFSFDEKNSILTHDITAENSFNDETYVISITHFNTLIHKYQPRNIIVRIYMEPRNFDDKLRNFMDNVVVKTIKDIGVKKIAFYFSNPKFIGLANHNQFSGHFKVKVFSDIHEAQEWVMMPID